jgi:hypothetical protein
MKKHMRLPILAAALFFSSAVSVTAANPMTMTVSLAQSFAPTTLTIRVQVEPNADNRELEVVAESSAYYRSSRLPLEGASAPRTTSLEIRNLPGGHYEVRGVLIDNAGRRRAAVRTEVVVLE